MRKAKQMSFRKNNQKKTVCVTSADVPYPVKRKIKEERTRERERERETERQRETERER